MIDPIKTNPLVAIQHDGDLSKIEDNTRLNSLVSHEEMTINEKFKSTYSNSFKCFLFMGTNRPAGDKLSPTIKFDADKFLANMNRLKIKIEHLKFNPPATTVFWSDGTKTVVKCDEDDIYDPEKGLAMAISKRAFGNQGDYYEEFKKWLPVEYRREQK